MSTPTLYKKVAQNLVKQSQRDQSRAQSRTMRAIEQSTHEDYDFDSVDETLDFCYQIDSDLTND